MGFLVTPVLLTLVLSFITLVKSTPDWTDQCPIACHCKWSSGKKTAACRDAGYTTIPSTLNSDLQVLDLTGNVIPYLTEDAFKSVDLINLQKVYIKNSRVHEVHNCAFRDLIILIEVDLSDNLITSVDPETFAGNLRLRVLILSGNPLRQLCEKQFPILPHLRVLELETCHLSFIHNNAFVNVIGLEKLSLKDNKLLELSESVFMPTAKLKTLILDNNPWFCDCRLRGFRNWLLNSNLYSMSLTCNGPTKLKTKTWQSVSPDEFACAPKILLSDKTYKVNEGENITLGCHVLGDPEPEVTWLYNGHVIGQVNATRPEQIIVIEVEEGLLNKWVNLSIINTSSYDAGAYTCMARNIEGTVYLNITVILPEPEKVASLNERDDFVLWFGVVCGGVATFILIVTVTICICCFICNRKRHKKRRRKGKIKGSVSFNDQEKKLLDLSITTDRQSGEVSCEALNAGSSNNDSIEMIEQSPSSASQPPSALSPSIVPIDICEQPLPLHITIESNPRQDNASVKSSPQSSQFQTITGYQNFPAPPPEFSTSILPVGTFGNILISVSVSQDPTTIDIQRYPDLLDIPHRSSNNPSLNNNTLPNNSILKNFKGVNIGTGPEAPYCITSDPDNFATIPRRQLRSVHSFSVRPKYDNMGPRVTAGGSCTTLALPQPSPNISIDEEIPSPPPPPICSPLNGEYVSL